MPVEHFTRDDLIGAVAGTILFAPFLLSPGFLLGWTFDLLGFRRLTRAWQALMSLALSVSVTPTVVFLIGTFISNNAIWVFYALATVLAVGVLVFRRAAAPRGNIPRWAIWATAGWAVAVWLSALDLRVGDRLYPSVFAYDWNLRTAFIDGIARRGFPVLNPLFFPGHPVLLRYHYFWFIACALVDRLGGAVVSARHTLVASDVWCGWTLMAVVALYLRFFHPAGERGLHNRLKWGIGILAIAGLDLLPNLFFDLANHFSGGWFVYSSAEWWNTPVTAFPHAVYFETHHVASMLACFTGFLLLWRALDTGRVHWPSVICAGLSFSSAVGLSVYVSLAFSLFLCVWGGYVLLRGRAAERAAWLAAGVVTVAGAAVYLNSLRQAGGSGGAFIEPTIRSFSPFDTVMPGLGFSWNQIAVANFLALPLNYFLETGAWFLLAWLWWSRSMRRRRRLSNASRAALTMFGVSIFVGTFLRSGTIVNNDLGWRSVLIAQLILVVWSVDPLRAWWRCRTRAAARGKQSPALSRWHFRMAALLVVGVLSTAYDFIWMRIYIPLSDSGAVMTAKWFTDDRQQGTRTLAVRQAYEQLDRMIPADAVLQANPNHWNDVYHGLYGLRQTASFDYLCGSIMGGDLKECERMQDSLMPLFNDPTLSRSLNVDQVCDAYGISVLVAKDNDPVFHEPWTWVWQRPALIENAKVRAVECGRNRQNRVGLTGALSKEPPPVSRSIGHDARTPTPGPALLRN